MENLQKRQKPNKAKKKPIKIKYISSPMMVQAKNASEFRAIVQELTGQNSNIVDHEDDQYDHDHISQYDTTTRLGKFEAPAPAPAAVSCWFSTHGDQEADHHPNRTVREINHVDEDLSNSTTTSSSYHNDQLPLLSQIDDEAHYWRSEVLSENSLYGFQSPCVFVG